jgi:23S rRNA pseudouridine1911/1915/1917 synthase
MELHVPPEATGERLDAFLARPLGSRSQAARLIEAGAVRVDGVAARKGHRVRGGDSIEVLDEQRSAAPAASDVPVARFAVAHEDDHLIVVDKPAGVVVHPARGHRHGTLAQALAGRIAGGEEDWRAGIVHRLDRDTSGLLVVAKSDAVHRALKAAIAARTMHREYLALVEGRPPARSGTIEAPIGRDRRMRTRMSTDTDVPKPAITHFELDRALAGATLLRVRLQTGRTHQIRVHMQAIGHPVCGDPDYGTAGLYGLRRQFLHAARLAFEHPVTDEALDVVSALPEDLAAALATAAKGSGAAGRRV